MTALLVFVRVSATVSATVSRALVTLAAFAILAGYTFYVAAVMLIAGTSLFTRAGTQ